MHSHLSFALPLITARPQHPMSSHSRRATYGDNPPYSVTSSSSSPYTTRRLLHHAPRASSPPASTYFSPPAGDDHIEMQPAPGAQAHFAYSTTLRRHNVPPTSPHGTAFPALESIRHAVTDQGPTGLWDRLLSTVKGKSGGSPEENGYLPVAKSEQTPSATYSSYDAEVRMFRVCASAFPEKMLSFQGCCRTTPDILNSWLDRRCHSLPSPGSWL